MSRKLLIIAGPTGVGKTDYAIDIALRLGSPVISCDSRQIYKEMTIGTAVPDALQLAAVRHYFVQTVSVTEPYTAGRYGAEALALIGRLFEEGHDTLVMCGGSGFYIEAVCNGLGSAPPSDPQLRAQISARLATEGLETLLEELHRLDPACYDTIDKANSRRVVRALEVCLLSGRPFSSFRPEGPSGRSFEIEKICLTRPREELYRRIDARVLRMMSDGLLNEVRSLLPYRNLPALQTVGYRELFDYIDAEQSSAPSWCGNRSLQESVALIQQHTRNYAKRQLSWWRRDPSVRWLVM